MSLSDALKDKKLDVRLRDKLLAQGRLKNEELDSYVNSLSDDTEKMTVIKQETKKEQAQEA